MRVFITKELHPFSPGGIGRVIANILATSSPAELGRTLVLNVGSDIEVETFRFTYPGVRFAQLSPSDLKPLDKEGRRYAPWESLEDAPFHRDSIAIMRALLRLQSELGEFEYVEFCDWAGPGFASIQEKRLGLAFANTTLAVRLHSTESILAVFENRHLPGSSYDIERKCLEDCDMVVAQLQAVASHVREFFGFDEADWSARVVIHPPPVLLDFEVSTTTSISPNSATPIVFSSKLQSFKRPDIFIAGAAAFLEAAPEYTGKVLLLAHAFDESYASTTRALVPERWASRIQFRPRVDRRERQSLIGRSICVFPSVYESFCLAAYEASLSGAVCILNEANPAFDASSAWVDGVNCLKFDGTTTGLHAALHRATRAESVALSTISLPEGRAPWSVHASTSPDSERSTGTAVSVVIAHTSGPDTLRRCLESVLGSTHLDVKAVIVDGTARDSLSQDILTRIEHASEGSIRVIRASEAASHGALYNASLPLIEGDFAVFMRSTATFSPDFLAIAKHGFDTDSRFDFVVPQGELLGCDGDTSARLPAPEAARLYLGNANAAGLRGNHCAGPVFAVRTMFVKQRPFPEHSAADLHWDYCLAASHDGARFVVTSTIECAHHEEVSDVTRADSPEMPPVLPRFARIGRVHVPLVSMLEPLAVAERPIELTSVEAAVVDEARLQRAIERTARKLRKLQRSPHAFFADSKAPLSQLVARWTKPGSK